jgi:hypothetical protein
LPKLSTPLLERESSEDPVEEEKVKISAILPAVPVRESLDEGVDDPIPTFPLARIVKSDVPVEDATLNGLSPDTPKTESVATGVEVPPIPTPALVT